MPGLPSKFHDQTQTVKLRACRACQAELDLSSFDPLTDIKCPHCQHQISVPGRLGKYKLKAIAGRGGMGNVYKAFDPGLSRFVAVKLLRTDRLADADFVNQLANEAVLCASVNHPNVGKVYATGTDHDRFYIVMELLEKGSLADLIHSRGKIPELQALDIGIQVASGLREANERGLIHRDVKPGNILFYDERTPKIVDFGLAMYQSQSQGEMGDVVGSPYYLPPERLDAVPEDFRSDIYALGATLFHAIAGRPIFEAENPTAVALMHWKSQPVSLQTYASHVSNETAFVINRMLAKDPDDRFASYDELIQNMQYARDQLQPKLGSQSHKARVILETEADQRAWGWVVVAMIAIVLTVSIGGMVIARKFLSGDQPNVPASEAAAPPARLPLTNDAIPINPIVSGPAPVAVSEPASEVIVEYPRAGTYRIVNRADGNSLEVSYKTKNDGDVVQTYRYRDAAHQHWITQPTPDNAFLVIAEHSGKALGIEAGRMESGAPVCQWTARNVPAMRWKIERLDDDWLKIVSESSGLVLTAGDTPNGSGVKPATQSEYTGDSRQQWQFVRLASSAIENVPAIQTNLSTPSLRTESGLAGRYAIIARESRKALVAETVSPTNGGRILQSEYVADQVKNDEWNLEDIGDGYLRILNVATGKALVVQGASKLEGAAILQWQYQPVGSRNDDWKFDRIGENLYRIVNAHSGKVLDATGGVTCVQSIDRGEVSQTFELKRLGGGD